MASPPDKLLCEGSSGQSGGQIGNVSWRHCALQHQSATTSVCPLVNAGGNKNRVSFRKNGLTSGKLVSAPIGQSSATDPFAEMPNQVLAVRAAPPIYETNPIREDGRKRSGTRSTMVFIGA